MFVDTQRKGTSRHADATYSNWFNGKDGVTNFHENDRTVNNEPPSLWPSHVITDEDPRHEHPVNNVRST